MKRMITLITALGLIISSGVPTYGYTASSAEIVGGTLSHKSFSQRLNDEYTKAVRAAVVEKMTREASVRDVESQSARTVADTPVSQSRPAEAPTGGSADAWASSAQAQAVIQCESGGNYAINTGNGYYGAWQFDAGTWLANGGGQYAPTADQATPSQQNEIAYQTYQSRGWQPWACAQ